MAQTFDTSRVGGGTYELEQDANGNYKLKSVGFAQVNKLNLPDLATSDTTTTTPKKEEEKKIEVADPFIKLGTQNQGGGEGGGQDYSAIAPKEAKVKEASVKDFSDRQRLDPRDDRSAQEIQNLQNAQATYRSTAPNLTSAPGYATSFSGTGQDLVDRKAANETIMSAQEKYRTETQYNPMPQTTGLQKVTSAVSNTVENIMNNSATVAVAKGVGKVIGGIANAMVSPEQQINNAANSTALISNGYITNQQGKVIGKDGQAVSAADSVFGGMNSVSGFGDISDGAASRIGTRNNIGQARVDAKYGKDSKKSKDFAAKTKEFERELQKHNNDKNSQKEAAKTKDTKSTNPNKREGAGDSGGCFIKGTLITMFDGSKKPVEQVDLGDKVAEGGNVFAAGRFLNTELYDYKGIKVSGSHMVNEDGTWMRVRDTKHGKSLGNDLNTVYVFGSENRRILINGILFTDYFEVNEQDKLIEDSEDFFNNWKDYGNDVDVDNVATLNMNYEI